MLAVGQWNNIWFFQMMGPNLWYQGYVVGIVWVKSSRSILYQWFWWFSKKALGTFGGIPPNFTAKKIQQLVFYFPPKGHSCAGMETSASGGSLEVWGSQQLSEMGANPTLLHIKGDHGYRRSNEIETTRCFLVSWVTCKTQPQDASEISHVTAFMVLPWNLAWKWSYQPL